MPATTLPPTARANLLKSGRVPGEANGCWDRRRPGTRCRRGYDELSSRIQLQPELPKRQGAIRPHPPYMAMGDPALAVWPWGLGENVESGRGIGTVAWGRGGVTRRAPRHRWP